MHYPPRAKLGMCESFKNKADVAERWAEIVKDDKIPNKLLIDENPDYKSRKCEVHLSNPMDL